MFVSRNKTNIVNEIIEVSSHLIILGWSGK
jgi:hypothetical protein